MELQLRQEQPEEFTVLEAAADLKVSRQRIMKLVSEGRLIGDPHAGHYWTIDGESVRNFQLKKRGWTKGKKRGPRAIMPPIHLNSKQSVALAAALGLTTEALTHAVEQAKTT